VGCKGLGKSLKKTTRKGLPQVKGKQNRKKTISKTLNRDKDTKKLLRIKKGKLSKSFHLRGHSTSNQIYVDDSLN